MLDRIKQQLELMKARSDESLEWNRFIKQEMAALQQ